MSEVQNTTAVHPLEEMGISPEVVQAFDWMGFKNLTAIQEKCIPLMMDGMILSLLLRLEREKHLGLAFR